MKWRIAEGAKHLVGLPRILAIRFIRTSSVIAFDAIEERLSRHRLNVGASLLERANESSATFIEEHISEALLFSGDEDIRLYAAAKCKESELNASSGVTTRRITCLEFGVFQGDSIKFWAKEFPDDLVVGFDSFMGLNETWGGTWMTKGTFNLDGELPRVPANVELVKGWVEDTVEEYVARNNLEDLKLVHMDLDTFGPTKYVLRSLAPYLKKGCLILFDEYLGFPGWQYGEHRALLESGLNVKYLAFTKGEKTGYSQALVEVA